MVPRHIKNSFISRTLSHIWKFAIFLLKSQKIITKFYWVPYIFTILHLLRLPKVIRKNITRFIQKMHLIYFCLTFSHLLIIEKWLNQGWKLNYAISKDYFVPLRNRKKNILIIKVYIIFNFHKIPSWLRLESKVYPFEILVF